MGGKVRTALPVLARAATVRVVPRPQLASLVALAALVTAVDVHAGESPRWPRWPTEVDRAAAPLRKNGEQLSPDPERVDALLALEVFATPVIEPWILLALDDPATAVKREALRVCYERELATCIAPATGLWRRASEPTLRISALRVVALDPQAERLELLLAALREDNDAMRGQAAQLLGWAPTRGEGRTKVRDALVAKLGDMSALVRQQAVESLGVVGDREATLPVARLLEDHEPLVQAAAAHALGNLGDPKAALALSRLLAAPGEPQVLRAALAALVRLPGERVATALLAAFDEPPTGLSTTEIADLVGLRHDPEPALLAGLVDRLREPGNARHALRALVLLGKPAAAPLSRAVRDRVLPPDLALEAERALAAAAATVRPGTAADELPTVAPIPWLDDTLVDRMRRAALSVTRPDPSTPTASEASVDATLTTADSLAPRMPELARLAVATRAASVGRRSRIPWARVIGWARDPTRSAAERCMAVLALGVVDRRAPAHEDASATVLELLGDADASLRACAAASVGRLVRDTSVRQLALLDPDARVRVMGVLAAWTYGMGAPARRRIAVLAIDDPSAEVRSAAQHVLSRPRPHRRGGEWLEDAARPFPWATSSVSTWLPLEIGTTRLWVPALAMAGRRFAIAPGLGGAIVVDE